MVVLLQREDFVPPYKFMFAGLTTIEDRLRRQASEIAYLMVWDRTDRKAEDPLGRFELTEDAARPYLDGGELADFVADACAPDALCGGEMDNEDTRDPRLGGDVAPRNLARAACRWLRDITMRNTVGEHYRRVRVRAYGVKGIRVVDTGTFVCRNHEVDLEIPLRTIGSLLKRSPEQAGFQNPLPTFDEAANVRAASSIKALGDFYLQWGERVLASVDQLEGVNRAMLGRLGKQLDKSRHYVDQLAAAALHPCPDERQDEARRVLANEALHMVGHIDSRDMFDVLGEVGTSPELVATLKDPDVRALLKEPLHSTALAGMLKSVAAVSRAAQYRANRPPEPDAQAA